MTGPCSLGPSLQTCCRGMCAGFADDVLDIPWRTKILMPLFASLPLVVAYSGKTPCLRPYRCHLLPMLHLARAQGGPRC